MFTIFFGVIAVEKKNQNTVWHNIMEFLERSQVTYLNILCSRIDLFEYQAKYYNNKNNTVKITSIIKTKKKSIKLPTRRS